MTYRSILFVPAKERMLNKLGKLDADAYVIDLEDSIEEEEKNLALERVRKILESIDLTSNNIFIRLNKSAYEKEIKVLQSFQVGFVLPKFERVSDYFKCEATWEEHQICALIETPYAIANIKDIVSTNYINAVAFGAEDYTAYIGMINDFNFLQYQKSLLVTYAKAYNKAVYDTPSFQILNQEKFKCEVDNAVALGFDGKMAINPKHISYLNERFSSYNLEYIQEIVRKYEQEGKAVLNLNGEVYEKMHIDRMKKILLKCKGLEKDNTTGMK